MRKRSTISDEFKTQLDDSPIGMLVNGSPAPAPKAAKPARENAKRVEPQDKAPKAERIPEGKERMTVQISKATIERVKDVVYWERMTVAQFVEEALESALTKFEKAERRSLPKAQGGAEAWAPRLSNHFTDFAANGSICSKNRVVQQVCVPRLIVFANLLGVVRSDFRYIIIVNEVAIVYLHVPRLSDLAAI